jgi:NADH-quinone oxidoreductase subunit J
MDVVFYLSGAVATVSTLMVITRSNAVHALLYLIVSLFAVALIFFALGAPFAAALEVIIYAGAIMVLFIFVIMMLNLGIQTQKQEREWLNPKAWVGPAILSGALVCELIYALTLHKGAVYAAVEITPKAVGISLFGPYLLGVELASLLLLAGLVGTYHLGRRDESSTAREGDAP